MGRNNVIVEFLEKEYWEPPKGKKHIEEIRVVPLTHRKVVYGINFFFRASEYLRTLDTFETIQELTHEITHDSADVKSYWGDYNHGFITIILYIAHESYTDDAIITLIKQIVKVLSKAKLPPSART